MLDETEVEEQQSRPVTSGSVIRKMVMVIMLTVASSAVGAAVSWLLIARTTGAHASASAAGPLSEQNEEEKRAEMIEKSAVLSLEPFVVNLADADAARYLRIKIVLVADDKAKMAKVGENEAIQLKIRDVILQSLTAKTSQDLINEDGKNSLRHEIQQKIAVYFRQAKLVDVMFTEFVIQL